MKDVDPLEQFIAPTCRKCDAVISEAQSDDNFGLCPECFEQEMVGWNEARRGK